MILCLCKENAGRPCPGIYYWAVAASTGLARELDRDVKRVHEDMSMLIKHGLVVRTADRKICVPYDVIHADFDLRAVA